MTEEEQIVLDEKKRKFVELREKTQEELIKMGLDTQEAQYKYLGISAVTYNKWRKKLERDNPESEIAIMDEELRKRALEGRNPKYMELYLKRKGALT
jgi:hypothetical protein